MVLFVINTIDSTLELSYVILWTVNIILSILIILFIFNKLYIKKEIQKKKEAKMYVYNLISWLIFILLICLSNICTISFQYLAINITLARLIERIAVILIYIALFIKVVYLEQALNKLKFYRGFFFSIVSFITIIIFLFVGPTTYKELSNAQLLMFLLIMSAIPYLFLPILYLYLAIKTAGKNRTDALKIFFGILLLSSGLLFQPLNLVIFMGGSEILDIIEATYIISPVLLIISTLLIFDSLRETE